MLNLKFQIDSLMHISKELQKQTYCITQQNLLNKDRQLIRPNICFERFTVVLRSVAEERVALLLNSPVVSDPISDISETEQSIAICAYF